MQGDWGCGRRVHMWVLGGCTVLLIGVAGGNWRGYRHCVSQGSWAHNSVARGLCAMSMVCGDAGPL